ncbi:MAG: glucose-6-phosphate isomerase [Thermovirgaceae bacterium]|nr:glucose-6-phosphate isomerase [Thermovirgaceae bacterium]
MLLRIGYGAAFSGLEHGFGPGPMEDCLRKSARALFEEAMEDRVGFGWLGLPDQSPAPLDETISWLRGFDTVVQIGIGGSALGNQMLSCALCHPCFNELSRKERGAPRFYVADNADPEGTSAILDIIDPSRTAFIVASKSGATAETMANFLLFLDALQKCGVTDPSENILVITDPQKGALRAFASETDCRSLAIPGSVGGRFSVLSPVGLLSAGAQGIDIGSVILGAAAMKESLLGADSLEDNPAWVLAGASILNYRHGRNMIVLMPYADRLESFSEWFCQLWGESLGKGGKGSTPVRAMGAIDQHSQVQLYSEGPDDKLFLILTPTARFDLKLPKPPFESLKSLAYLEGKGMGSMLELEARSTAAALIKAEKPLLWMEIPVVDAYRIGSLVFFFEYATALAGLAMGLNPFDQPGVEQGKRYTYGLMGRPGFEKDAGEARERFSSAMSRSVKV